MGNKTSATQADKYHLSLAAEYYVAAELQRQGLHASVTYGNAKQTDIVVFSDASALAVVVEVKATSKDSWIVGGQVPPPAGKPWVFVYIPQASGAPPQYFVLTQSELHEILQPRDERYRETYQSKHGRAFKGPGVVTLSRRDAEPHLGKWPKILAIMRAAPATSDLPAADTHGVGPLDCQPLAAAHAIPTQLSSSSPSSSSTSSSSSSTDIESM